eukprot:gene16255-biopygen3757
MLPTWTSHCTVRRRTLPAARCSMESAVHRGRGAPAGALQLQAPGADGGHAGARRSDCRAPPPLGADDAAAAAAVRAALLLCTPADDEADALPPPSPWLRAAAGLALAPVRATKEGENGSGRTH